MDKSAELAGASSANNSSDFVRKLYKMLEDPTYDSIVRWGEGGESFVVLENEKFTKSILPKHFKHSNFASFVRQLNKYDFHKVRHNNEDNVPSPYGPNAWEFKHPEFQANKKDNLDNIRRKAPAPRKMAQNSEESYAANQQVEMLQSQLMATQQQVTNISDKFNDLAQGHVVLLQQVVSLQKLVKNHDGVMHKMLGFLHSTDAQRRNSRIEGRFANGASALGAEGSQNDIDDHPASPLQQASELLEGYSAANLPDKTLEQMTQDYGHLRSDYSTPPNEHGNQIVPHSAVPTNQIGAYALADLDSMVYPVGHTNGIDPVNAEHIHNIPYSLPPQVSGHIVTEAEDETQMFPGGKRSFHEQVWGINKPRVLLVEDDKMCARIGSRFLQLYECGVEIARDGLEAVNKINQAGTGPGTFNLILMDIIMPNLDGVSATVCIREILPNTPIIAMTSNIRADDIDMYFRYGMNDVLPKPFTKEGMLKALQKHLPGFLKDAQSQPHPQFQAQPGGGFSAPGATQQPLGLNMGQLSAAQSLKDEASPGKSPATATSWHSPNQMPGQSPIGNGPIGFMQQQTMQQPMRDNPYGAMTPTHQHPQAGFPPQPNTPLGHRGPTHKRVISDMTGGPEEHSDRRRPMYAPQPPGYHP